jgi:vancomycin resistance protein YoaR
VETDGPQATRRSSRRRWWVVIGVVLTLLVVGGAYLAAYSYAGTTVPVGTTVLGIDIGGQTQDEAEATLRDELPPIADAPITLLVGRDSYPITPSQSGLNVDVPATVRAAGVGASDPVRLVESIIGGGGPVDPVVVVDEEALGQAVDEVADDADRDPVEGAVDFVQGNVEATLPQQGRTVERPAAVDAVAEAYLARSAPVSLPVDTTDPTVTADEVERAVQEFAEPAMSAPVTVESSVATRTLGTRLLGRVLSMQPEDGVLVPVLDADALLEASQGRLDALGRPATDASAAIRAGRPVVVPSSTGQQVDTSTYADDVFAALTESGDDRTVTLPVVPKPADFTTADARASGVEQVVAEFTTFYPHADYRNVNIGRAAELANNTFLKPGDVFSMNDVVGERRVDRGFTSGFIIESGRFAEAVGGGVSQLATTLFNAGHFAGFENVEHHPHTLYIDRYPVGREATVFWGSWDLQFGNNTPYGAVVQSFINPSSPGTTGSVTVRIWSTPYWDVKSVTGDRFNFRPYERRVISGGGCVPSSGSDGFDIIVTRTLSLDGEVQEREELYTRYEATPEVVCTG